MKRNGTTRKTFLGVLGATLAAPLLARSTGRQTHNTQPDVVRQAEVQAAFHDLEAFSDRMRGFRRRMLAGATIEGGAMTVEFEPGPLEPEESYSRQWDTIEDFGLLLRRR